MPIINIVCLVFFLLFQSENWIINVIFSSMKNVKVSQSKTPSAKLNDLYLHPLTLSPTLNYSYLRKRIGDMVCFIFSHIFITRPGVILTSPGKIVTCPGKILTRLGKILTRPGEILTRPGEKLTRLGKILTRPGEILTRPGKILTCPGEIGY